METPRFESHFRPRSREGRRLLLLFLVLFLLAEPPLLSFANRIEPWVLGVPFLYAYLSFLYASLIGVLLLALRRGL